MYINTCVVPDGNTIKASILHYLHQRFLPNAFFRLLPTPREVFSLFIISLVVTAIPLQNVFLSDFSRPPADSLFRLLSKSRAFTVQNYPDYDDDTLIQRFDTHGLATRPTRSDLVDGLVSCKARRRSVHEQCSWRRRNGRARRTSSGRLTKITALPSHIQQRTAHCKTKPAGAS